VGPAAERPGFFADLFQSRYREVTWSALIFAVVIGVVMNAAITYAGLKIGFTIGGSAIAAVLGFGFLRGVLRKGTILETNIVQTVASAVNTSNSGVIFTVPVLFLIGYRLSIDSADFWLITLACIAGGMLGTAFIIPLRKQMIEVDRLRFPSPTAVATILKSPGAGSAKAVVLVIGLLVGALIFLPTQLATITELIGMEKPFGLADIAGIGTKQGGVVANETIDVGTLFGLPPQVQLIFAIAPFALGAGFLTGRAGLFVIAGGILAFFVLNPIAFAMGWMPETITAEKAAGYGFTAFNRPLGIGLLLGGAFMGILFALPAMKEALKSVISASRVKGGGDELGIRTLAVAIVASFVFLFLAADIVGNKPVNLTCPITAAPIVDGVEPASHAGYAIGFATADAATTWNAWTDTQRDAYLDTLNAKPGLLAGFNPHLKAALIALFGALWIWFAGIIISQCAGMTDWSPISGMALLTVILVLLLAGSGAVVGAVLIGAALCVAITLASDMMGDLKTGHLVGAMPRRQQITEMAAVAIGPVVCMLTIALIASVNLERTGGALAFGPGTETVAPQAQALQAVITGVQGGEMPYALYGIGGVLGILLGLGAFAGLGVLVGLSMYLPFTYIATYGIGCLINIAIVRWKGRTWSEDWGVPFCAGLIVGESILALVVNICVLLVN